MNSSTALCLMHAKHNPYIWFYNVVIEGENLRNLESDHKNWFPLPQKGKCNQQLLFKVGNAKHSQRYSYYLMCEDVHGMVKYWKQL